MTPAILSEFKHLAICCTAVAVLAVDANFPNYGSIKHLVPDIYSYCCSAYIGAVGAKKSGHAPGLGPLLFLVSADPAPPGARLPHMRVPFHPPLPTSFL